MKKKNKFFLWGSSILVSASVISLSIISCSNNNDNSNSASQFSPTTTSLNLYTNSSNGTENNSDVLSYFTSSIGNRVISITGNFVVNSATQKDYFGLMIAKSCLTYNDINQMYEEALSRNVSQSDNAYNTYQELFSNADIIYASGWSNLFDTTTGQIATNFIQINRSGSVTFNLLKALGTYQYSENTTYSLYLIGVNGNYNGNDNTTQQNVLDSLPSLEVFEKVSNFNINLSEKTSWGKFSLSQTLPTLNVNNIYDSHLTINGNLELYDFNGSYYSFVLAATPNILDYAWSTNADFTKNNSYFIDSNNFSETINNLSFDNYGYITDLLNNASFHNLYLILVVANSIQNLHDGDFELYQSIGQVTLSN